MGNSSHINIKFVFITEGGKNLKSTIKTEMLQLLLSTIVCVSSGYDAIGLSEWNRFPSTGQNEAAKTALQKTNPGVIENLEMANFMQFEGWNASDFSIDFVELSRTMNRVQQNNRLRNFNRLGPSGHIPQADKDFMMKFLQLKYSIIYLQRNKIFGKYCFYGCWCLPNADADFGVGIGAPVDNIDRSCKEFSTCYNCLFNPQIGKNCQDDYKGRYTVLGRVDKVSGNRHLVCLDKPGSCLRMRCECDKALATKLQQYESEWKIQFHRRWGRAPLNAETDCKSGSIARMTQFSQKVTSQTLSDLDPVELGFKSLNFELTSPPILGPIVGCCGFAPNLHYYREGQKCCENGAVLPAGSNCL